MLVMIFLVSHECLQALPDWQPNPGEITHLCHGYVDFLKEFKVFVGI
jgi:hypothetical protein